METKNTTKPQGFEALRAREKMRGSEQNMANKMSFGELRVAASSFATPQEDSELPTVGEYYDQRIEAAKERGIYGKEGVETDIDALKKLNEAEEQEEEQATTSENKKAEYRRGILASHVENITSPTEGDLHRNYIQATDINRKDGRYGTWYDAYNNAMHNAKSKYGEVTAYNVEQYADEATNQILGWLKKDSDGLIVSTSVSDNGKRMRYTHDDVYSVLFPIVYNNIVQDKMEDRQFTKQYVERVSGKSYNEVLRERAEEAKQVIKDNKKWALSVTEEAWKKNNSTDRKVAAWFWGDDTSLDILKADVALPYDRMLDQIEAWEENDFGSGFVANFDWSNILTLGYIGGRAEERVGDVYAKVEAGKELNVQEAYLFKAMQAMDYIGSVRNDIYEPQGVMSSIGGALGESTEELPTFIFGSKGAGKALKALGWAKKSNSGYKAAKAAKAVKTAKGFGKVKAFGNYAYESGKLFAKNRISNFGRDAVQAGMATTISPSTYTRLQESWNEQYSINPDGSVTFTPKGTMTLYATPIVNQWAEYYSELWGAAFYDDIVKMSPYNLGSLLRFNRATKAGATATAALSPTKKKIIADIARSAGWSGSLGAEITGEAYGDILSTAINSLYDKNANWESFSDPNYWLTLIGVSSVMGGGISVFNAPSQIKRVNYIHSVAQKRAYVLSQISDKGLRDRLTTLANSDPSVLATELANTNWESIKNPADKAYAYDFASLNAQVQVALGYEMEGTRLAKFDATRKEIESHEYKQGGKGTGLIVTAVDSAGNEYYVIEGNSAESESMLKCIDKKTGKKVAKIASDLTITANDISLAEEVHKAYQDTFSVEIETERLLNEYDALKSLEDPTPEAVDNTMAAFGIIRPKQGEMVTLTDGRQAKVIEDVGDGIFIVESVDAEGNPMTESISFTRIQSSDPMTAIAQRQVVDFDVALEEIAKAQQETPAIDNKPLQPSEPIQATETPLQTPEVTQSREHKYKSGDVVMSPSGKQARVVGYERGAVIIDYNLDANAPVADKELDFVAENTLSTIGETTAEATTPAMTTPSAPTTEASAPAEVSQSEEQVIERTKDGEIDYGKINNVDLLAKLLIKNFGGLAKALKLVKKWIANTDKQIKKIEEKAENATSPNEEAEAETKIRELTALKNKYEAARAIIERRVAEEQQQKMQEVKAKKHDHTRHPEAGLVRDENTATMDEGFLNLVDRMAKALGVKVSFTDKPLAHGAEGQYNGNEVTIYVKARTKTFSMLLGHEMMHHMREVSPEMYEAFKNAIKDYMGEEAFLTAVTARVASYQAQGVPIDNELAAEEICADEAGKIVDNEHVFYEFLESVDKKNSRAQRNRFLRGLLKVVDYISDKVSKMGVPEVDAKIKKRRNALLDLLNDVYEKQKNATAEEAKGEEGKTSHSLKVEMEEAASRIEDNFGEVDIKRGDVKYALRDVLPKTEVEQAVQDLMRVTGRSRGTVERYLKAEQSLAKFILSGDNAAYLDYEADDSVPSIWENSDYPQGTVEFSNICRKRLPLTMIYQKLQKEFPNTKFNKTQLETIRQTLIANGIDVACGLCFVEDRRQHNDEIGQGFIDALSGKDVYVNANQQKAIDKLRESGDNYIPNLYELLTLDGMKKLRMEHPEVANAFIKYNNARGQQAGRLFQAYSAYHREILKFNNARVKKTNDVGGLRIFSFSDFEAHHLIDLVQVLTDCARKGIKVQGYTKVPEFALAVKDTNMKLNRSLIAKDNGVVEADYSPKTGEAVSPNVIDGKRLLLDTVEGIDVNDKNFFDSSASKNVGNILVGVNDEQIRIAMLDPFVDYIIPFHTGLSADILKQKGISDWKNYKYEQIEKTIVDGKMVNAKTHVNIYTDVLSDDIKNEKQFVERYLEVCKEKNLVPKFARFLNRDKAGNFVYAKGYYKFLLDFKMFDAKGRILPQEVVQPIFNDEVNKQILDDYVKGEKEQSPNEEVYEEVKEALGLGEKTKYSLATDVASILEEYDTDGVKYGSILDVADGIEAVIAESTENATELENILNDFRAAQDDARRWGNRMDSGGEEEFEEALRAYVNKATLGERSGVISGDSSSEGLLASPNGPLSLVSFGNKQDATKVKSFEDISKATREIMPRIKKVINRGGLEDVRTEVDAVRAVGRALKLEPSHSSKSYYGEYFEGDYSVAGDIVRVRVSTHPANPLEITKVRKGVDPDHKVSIVIRKNGEHKSDGTPHSGYTEYVYEPSEVTPQDAANAVVKGVKSLLETGEFVDETGKAVRKDYPYTDKSGTTMYSLITPEMDASYLDAVERDDMETAQQMVMEAAEKAGYTEKVYHGTSQFGFTSFSSYRPSGATFTSDNSLVSEGYGKGIKGYLGRVRNINKPLKPVRNINDAIYNARSVFNEDWRLATEEEKRRVIGRVEEDAREMRDEIKARKVDMPEELRENVMWIENIVYYLAEARYDGIKKEELSNRLREYYRLYQKSKEALEIYIHYNLTEGQKEYLRFLVGDKVGDVAIGIGQSYANAIIENDLATVDGNYLVNISTLEQLVKEAKRYGSYQLYGNLGRKPLEIDADHRNWNNLDFKGMHSTDVIVEWAKENGYTSVVFKNIYDGGPLSNVKVFYDSNQLKSADPVTYDDDGNVIPLSERFNPEKKDIRYSLMQPTNEEVTFDNFFKNTSAVFEVLPKSEVPQREPDYTSERWDGFGVSSRYWYGEDGLGKYVIRESNHWSDYPQGERTREAFEAEPYNKRYTRISSCRWALAVSKEQVTTEKDSYLDGDKMYGKAYLDEFTKWEEKEDIAPKDQIFLKDGIAYAAEAVEEATRYSLPEPTETSSTRYALPEGRFENVDLPYIDEYGNVVETRPLRQQNKYGDMEARIERNHQSNLRNIRKEAEEARKQAKAYAREQRKKRRAEVKSKSGYAAKVAYLLGDNALEDMPLEVQAMAMIANGLKVKWEDKVENGKVVSRGLASELGLSQSKAEKSSYRGVVYGATKTLDEVVHEWWELIDGHAKGIDDNDLRNALINVLQSCPSASSALTALYNTLDSVEQELQNALEGADRMEYEDTQAENARYEAEMSAMDNDEYGAYEEDAKAQMSATEEIIEELIGRINRKTRRIERIHRRRKNQYREIYDAINDGKKTIIDALNAMEKIDYTRANVKYLLERASQVRSLRDLQRVAAEVEEYLTSISIREEMHKMDAYLKQRLPSGVNVAAWVQRKIEEGTMTEEEGKQMMGELWKKTNSRGVSVAKHIDGDTASILSQLSDLLSFRVRRMKKTTDAEGDEKRSLSPDMEVSIDVESKQVENENQLAKIEEKLAEKDDALLTNEKVARHFYSAYLNVVAKKQAYIMARSLHERNKANGDYSSVTAADVAGERALYLEALREFNMSLENMLVQGKESLREFNAMKEAHRKEIVNLGINAIGGSPANHRERTPATAWEKLRAKIRVTVDSGYWTFQTALRAIDRWAPNGKGKFYDHFMGMWQKANNDLIDLHGEHIARIADKIYRFFGDKYKGLNPFEALEAITRDADNKIIATLDTTMPNGNKESVTLTMSAAMYTIAMWRQSRYRKGLETMGITEDDIQKLHEALDAEHEGYVDFMDWVNEEFLPDTRLEYDKVFREIYGTSMDKETNYFPARVDRNQVAVDLQTEGAHGSIPSTVTRSNISRKGSGQKIVLRTNYFEVLRQHLLERDKWHTHIHLIEDLNALLSNKEFKYRLEDHMKGLGKDGSGKGSLYEIFKNTALIATGFYHGGDNNVMAGIQKAWATSNIAFRLHTAVKQISGAAVFAAYSINPLDVATWMKNAAIGISGVGTIKLAEWAMENSPSFRNRWQSRAAGHYELTREIKGKSDVANKRGVMTRGQDALGDAINKFAGRWGMLPNAAIDALACAIGMKTVYDIEIRRMTKGKREATAEEKQKALRKAEVAFNATQQSSESAYLSTLQMNKSLVSALFTTYLNASFSLHRMNEAALKELYKLITSKKYKETLKLDWGEGAVRSATFTAISELLQGFIGIVGFASMNVLIPLLMGKIFGGLDDDEYEKLKREFYLECLMSMTSGYVGANLVGYPLKSWWETGRVQDLDLGPAWNELWREGFDILEADTWSQRGMETLDLIFRFKVGVDIGTFYNVGLGIDELMDGNADEAGTWYKMLNAPERAIKLFVYDRKDGETEKEYIERIMRFYALFESADEIKYEDYLNDKGKFSVDKAPSRGMTKSQANDLPKEFEAAFARNISDRFLDGGYKRYKEVTERYSNVLKDLNMSEGALYINNITPAMERMYEFYDGDMKSERGGITTTEYGELLRLMQKASYQTKMRERFAGDDDGYAEYLKAEIEAKQQFIDKYNEYIK